MSSISALAYGFMGSQDLFAALELGLFTALAEEPSGLETLAAKLQAPRGPLSVLLSTCLALDLVTWDGERYANSPTAQRFLVKTARGYVGDYYLRQVSFLIYDRLPLVCHLLRGQPVETLDYAHMLATPHLTEEFIRGQHAGSLGPATLVDEGTVRTTVKEEQRSAQAEIAAYEERQWCAYERSNAEFAKCARYCRKQRELLRQVADLAESEREMLRWTMPKIR